MWKRILLGTLFFVGLFFATSTNSQQAQAASCILDGGTGCGFKNGVCCAGDVCMGYAGSLPSSWKCVSLTSNTFKNSGNSGNLACAYNSSLTPLSDNLELYSSASNTSPVVEPEYCGMVGYDCSPTQGCYPPNTLTCFQAVQGWCQTWNGCLANSSDTINSTSYECGNYGDVCCRTKQCPDVGGKCSKFYTSCTTQYGSNYMDYNNGQLDSTCSNGTGAYAQCCVLKPNCNGGAVYGSWGTCSAPSNTCYNGNGSQSRSCTYTTYNGSTTCIQQSCGTQSQACTTNNCYSGYTCPAGTCITNIYAYAYTDYNHTGTNNGGLKNGVNISDGGGNTFATGSNGWSTGQVIFSGKTAVKTYTISETAPTNFKTTGNASQNVTLGGANQSVNFYVTPLYNISGSLFSDTNKDGKKDNGESNYSGGGIIQISGGPTTVANITVGASGTWTTPTNLESGTYTVSYTTALPTNYSFTTPSSYSVTVGNPLGSIKCATGGSADASCGGINNGSIANLNVGVTNENTWTQTVCMDVRNDSGTYTNLIPAAPSCGGANGPYNSIVNGDCSTGAGILYTCNATPDLGLGYANANQWQAGGSATNQQECFVNQGLNVVRTSYEYLLTTMQQSGITPTDMTTVCGTGGLADCALPASLPKGVYLANGDVNLATGSGTYTFPVDPTTPQGFIFLINGNLKIFSNIIVPRGSVAAFSTAKGIEVDQSVGQLVNATTIANGTVNDPNIEGLYSADSSFTVDSYGSGTTVCNADGTPLDLKLNVIGSIVTNAAKQGGSFIDNRDMCVYDTECPAVSGGDGNPGTGDEGLGLSYILTLYGDGKFLNHQVFNWQELQP